jgi:hypothetical protein
MPLVYRDRGTTGRQIAVFSHELRIASIGKDVLSGMANHAVRWRWDFAISAGLPPADAHGFADSLEEAKANVERIWEAWLAKAALAERDALTLQGGQS